MSTFRGHAKSLSSAFVFYERLWDTYPRMYKYTKSTAKRINKQTHKYTKENDFVESMAKAEFEKEKKLLSQMFGINFNFDYYGNGIPVKEGISEVIDAINEVLNIKEVYERNKLLLKTSKGGQKALFSWYPTYFLRAFDVYWPKILADFNRKLGQNKNVGDTLRLSIDKYIEKICILGIEEMLDGPEVENSIYKIAPELKTAYKDLLQNIGTISDENSMAGQIFRIYQLDKIKDSIVESLSPKDPINKKNIKKYAKQIVEKNIYARGGLTLEAFETAIFQNQTSAKGGVVIHSGKTEVKADNILTLGIDPSIIYEALEEGGADREKNIKAFNELGEKISNMKEGFIVYSSDKNYKVDSNFHGFSAGSTGINAATFLGEVYKGRGSLFTLLGAIQQLGEGAILQGDSKIYEELIAQDVAYMLFDDFSTIGQKDTGGNSIHVMNLNGIMFPLSAILFLLSEAINSVDDNYSLRKIVDVNIESPAIEFPTKESQLDWMNKHPNQNPWDYQRQKAIDETIISAKILKNFRRIILDFL